jgi:DNA-binding XRE family transcriptional regulator
MGVLQTITSPSGDELVVITKAEYDILVSRHLEALEDAIDGLAADEALARLASGEDEALPMSFVARICAGENRVLVWREYRGLSQRALAKAAGVSPGHLSDIEHGRRSGSVDALKRIAAALKVRIDDLIA